MIIAETQSYERNHADPDNSHSICCAQSLDENTHHRWWYIQYLPLILSELLNSRRQSAVEFQFFALFKSHRKVCQRERSRGPRSVRLCSYLQVSRKAIIHPRCPSSIILATRCQVCTRPSRVAHTTALQQDLSALKRFNSVSFCWKKVAVMFSLYICICALAVIRIKHCEICDTWSVRFCTSDYFYSRESVNFFFELNVSSRPGRTTQLEFRLNCTIWEDIEGVENIHLSNQFSLFDDCQERDVQTTLSRSTFVPSGSSKETFKSLSIVFEINDRDMQARKE